MLADMAKFDAEEKWDTGEATAVSMPLLWNIGPLVMTLQKQQRYNLRVDKEIIIHFQADPWLGLTFLLIKYSNKFIIKIL